MSVQTADFELVVRALSHARDEDFPNAGRPERPHLVKPPVPIIEISDDADPLRIRRPNGEAGAMHTVNGSQLRAEFVINAPLIPFAEKIQVSLAQRRQKGIRIAASANFSIVTGYHQVIGIDTIRLSGGSLEDVTFGNALELDG